MTCKTCSGSGETGMYGILDCTDCNAATERAALNAAVTSAELMSGYDERWFAYQLGKKAACYTKDSTDAQDAALWRRLIKDMGANPCTHPCLRDDLGDWMSEYFEYLSYHDAIFNNIMEQQ